jgi:hypothetical protein
MPKTAKAKIWPLRTLGVNCEEFLIRVSIQKRLSLSFINHQLSCEANYSISLKVLPILLLKYNPKLNAYP